VPVSDTEPADPPGPPGAADLAGIKGPPGTPDLAAAVADAQHGSPDAFRALYRDTQPRLLRYLHALVGDDAEDIASETWLHVTRDLHTFHGDYDGFRGWVATIARHPLARAMRAEPWPMTCRARRRSRWSTLCSGRSTWP